MCIRDRLGSEKLSALATAFQHNGLVIMADREISLPLAILHFISGDNVAVFPSTLLIAKTGSRLRILERHMCIRDRSGTDLRFIPQEPETRGAGRFLPVPAAAMRLSLIHI